MAVPCLAALAATARADADLQGMWSDPPTTTADTICMFACTDWLMERFNALLDDPANNARPAFELLFVAEQEQHERFIVPRLTAASLATVNRDPADDPSFLYCEPPGFARQIFTPHQLKITASSADRIEMHYGEWDARRTVWMDGRGKPPGAPPTPMGFSVGRYDGDTLVIETTGIAPNLAPWYGRHGEHLRVVERYARSADGTRLLLTATFEDPWALAEPLVYKKVWGFAPEQEIFPYEDCEQPTEVTRGAGFL
jgi:hypothetical protein